MKTAKSLMCLSIFTALLAGQPAKAEDAGKWLVRLRALDVVPQESSDVSIGGKVGLSSNVVPEVDVSYFFTPNLALELIAATTKHNVKLKGSADLGDVWLLPPTLTLQYHFTQSDLVKPYVGAGINYTHFYNADPGALDSAHYSDSFGSVLQAGFDIPIKNNWYFNMDVKKIWLSTDVSFNRGAVTANVDIDPWIFGTGFGYRF